MSTPLFDAEARARLAALADALIPAGDGMPSASEAGVAGEWLDAIVATTDPGGWGTLTTVVAGAYFLNPAIAEAVGYPGRRAISVDQGDAPDWLEDGLLDSVRARGPVYRPTP